MIPGVCFDQWFTTPSLSQAISEYMVLRQQADRLQIISEHSETIIFDAYEKIEPMYNALSYSVRALEELAEGMSIFSEIEKSNSVVPDLIGRCKTLAASACMWQDRVSKVLQSCQVNIPSVLLRGAFPTS